MRFYWRTNTSQSISVQDENEPFLKNVKTLQIRNN